MISADTDAACRDLIIRALRALDSRDYDTVTQSFADDGVWERGAETLTGPIEVRGALDKRPAALETQHVTSNMVIDQTSNNSAEARYTILAYAQTATEAYHLHAIFAAVDSLIQTPAGWRFARRTAVPAFSNKA